MNNVQIYPFFYGTGFTNADKTARTDVLAAIAAYYNQVNVPGGLFVNKPTIRQYGVVSAFVHPAAQTANSLSARLMTDTMIRNAIHASQGTGLLPQYAHNVLIYVFLGPGFTQSGNSSPCGSYHSWESDSAYYAVTPHCNGLDVIQHEVSEAATDPSGTGWYGTDLGDESQDNCSVGGSYTFNGTTIGIGGADNTQGGACSTTGYYGINFVGRGDILLTGPTSWNTIPVAFNINNNGTFATRNEPNSLLASFAAAAGSRVASGDFNGDGITDLVAMKPGSTNVVSGYGMGDGTFVNVANVLDSFVTGVATQPNVTVVSGDYDGNGCTDMAMMGNSSWTTLPVAFSNCNGTFWWTNLPNSFWATNAAKSGVKVVGGDFDDDGLGDIAMMGNNAWTTVPVAFSNGDGTFDVTNVSNSFWAANAAALDVKAVSGDFNGDGRTDIAMMGNVTWNTVPVASSNGDGSFTITNVPNSFWASHAIAAGVKIVAGRFSSDTKDDMAMMGNPGWTTVPVARSTGAGAFTTTNRGNVTWASMAAVSGVKALGARINTSP